MARRRRVRLRPHLPGPRGGADLRRDGAGRETRLEPPRGCGQGAAGDRRAGEDRLGRPLSGHGRLESSPAPVLCRAMNPRELTAHATRHLPGRGLKITLTGEERVMALLLVFVPLTVLGPLVRLPTWITFFISVAAVVPLAAFIGSATEALADRLGAKVGGLLNATFGNSPDLLIGIFGVQKGLIPLVKATLIGALISNSALIMGLCYMVAGLAYGRPRFRRLEAGHHSVLMMLTLAAVLFPSVGALVLCGGSRCGSGDSGQRVLEVSVGISVALLLAYGAYVLFGILGLESFHGTKPADTRYL